VCRVKRLCTLFQELRLVTVVTGVTVVSQLSDEIFLLLHSALQLHYLKVAEIS